MSATAGALTLTRPQKAAAILVAMGKPAAGKMLKFFKQDELKALVDGARKLRTIPQAELDRIVSEFEAEFAEGAGLLDSADSMDNILSENLSAEEMSALMDRGHAPDAYDEPEAPSVWPEISKLEPQRLGAFLSVEHPQTVAMILANLESQAAAGALVNLPTDMRGQVVKRMMSMTAIPDSARRMVENQLRRRMLAADSGPKDNSAGQIRVANVLNQLDKDSLDAVMADLEASGATDVAALKARLFSFEDLILLSQKGRVSLFDGLSTELVTVALRNASADLSEAILSALGARARRMIESELASPADNLSADDISKARKSIASAAIRLAGEGTITLPTMAQAA